MHFGTVPTEDLSIAANKPYVFIYSSFSSASDIQRKLSELSAYAENIAATKSGLFTVTVTLTPLYAMKLSAWRNLFDGIGLHDLTDMYVGGPASQTDQGFHPVDNVVTFWEPKLEAAGSAIKSGVSSAASGISSMFDYLKWIVVGGAVIVGGVVILKYLPEPKYKQTPQVQQNPKRRRRR
jgi:hypothetical protein